MASIKKREGKNGISYLITVTQGKTSDGKQVRRYMTFTPPSILNQRQAAAAAKRAAQEFEDKLARGYEADNRQTFAEYAQYVLKLKEDSGCKHKTLDDYRSMLTRINAAIGHLRLTEIRPSHLNIFYQNLGQDGTRAGKDRAAAKKDIAPLVKSQKLSMKVFAEKAHVSLPTLSKAVNGEKILADKARSIAKALGYKLTELFEVTRNTSPLSKKTITEYHHLISTILHQADKEMIVPYNAAAKATPPKLERREAVSLQPSDVQQILNCINGEPIKWKTIIHLLIVTGCRRGEIAGLKWNKINWERGELLIDCALLYTSKRGVYESSTKTGNRRRIRLPAETIQQLLEYRSWYVLQRMQYGLAWTESDYVFVRDGGGPIHPDSINTFLDKFSDKYGFDHINPHMFRHTMASLLISSGTDPVTVSKRLGHAKASTTTDIYSHLIEQADVAAGESIASAIFGEKK